MIILISKRVNTFGDFRYMVNSGKASVNKSDPITTEML